MGRGVVKFWKLVANPGQWLTNLGGPDQIQVARIINYFPIVIEKKIVSYLSILFVLLRSFNVISAHKLYLWKLLNFLCKFLANTICWTYIN